MDYLPICSSIAANLATFLNNLPYQHQSIINGKAKHEIDCQASEIVRSCLADYPINLYLEGDHQSSILTLTILYLLIQSTGHPTGYVKWVTRL